MNRYEVKQMRKTALVILGLVVILGALGVTLFSTALAQPIVTATGMMQMMQTGGTMHSRGMMSMLRAEEQGWTGMSCHGDEDEYAMLGPLAKALGMTESQLQAELQAGKRLKEIAQARELDDQKLAAALLTAMREQMEQHVQNGDLARADADAMLQHMEQIGPSHLLGMMDGDMSGDMAGCGIGDGDMMSGGMMGHPNFDMMPPGFMDGAGAGCHDDGILGSMM